MHRIQCKCGILKGHIKDGGISNRVVCYCADCQAFARFLGHPDDVLDTSSGTEIVQVAQPRLVFSQGREQLAAMKLSEKGMLRWYAACCKTPLGNIMSNPKLSSIGIIHSVLDHTKMDVDFGKGFAVFNTASATGQPRSAQKGAFGAILRLLGIIFSTLPGGRYKASPLFDESGAPVAHPQTLTSEERHDLETTH